MAETDAFKTLEARHAALLACYRAQDWTGAGLDGPRSQEPGQARAQRAHQIVMPVSPWWTW